jgi:hypothetical protein
MPDFKSGANREETGVRAKAVFGKSGRENAWCPLFEFCGHQAFSESRKVLELKRKEEQELGGRDSNPDRRIQSA